MLINFVDREEELAFLEEKYRSEGFELIIIYGRRRVGKTELIKKFIHDKPSIYCLSSLEDKEKQLEGIGNDISNYFGGIKPYIREWEDLFQYFTEKAPEGTILVIDEFPYLMEENNSIPSYFQKFVDEYLKNKNLMVILCGSSIGMMEDLKSYKNPLYGRRTGQIDLKQFKFKDARKMLPKTNFQEEIRYYSVFGGIPFYLQKITESTLRDNIKEKICRNVEILHEEPYILLRQEFRKPNRYFSIMESVSSGHTTPKAISDSTKIPLQSVPKYLGELERVRLISHIFPVTDREKKSRRGIYEISDNFFDFWFRFLSPHLSDVEKGYDEFVDDHVMPGLDRYVGRKFENVCIEFLREISKLEGKIRFTKIGKWWYKEEEIDVVALNERDKHIYFGECKWSNNKVGTSLLQDLKEKAKNVRWLSDDRTEEYILFSKSSFTSGLIKEANKDENISLYDLNDMERCFTAVKT